MKGEESVFDLESRFRGTIYLIRCFCRNLSAQMFVGLLFTFSIKNRPARAFIPIGALPVSIKTDSQLVNAHFLIFD